MSHNARKMHEMWETKMCDNYVFLVEMLSYVFDEKNTIFHFINMISILYLYLCPNHHLEILTSN